MSRTLQFAVALLAGAPAACGSAGSAPAAVLSPPVVSSVTVVIDPVQLPVGSRAAARAIAADRFGGALASTVTVWSVSEGGEVASITPDGVVSALSVGSAVIAATVDSVTGTRRIDVVPADEGQRGNQLPALPQVTLDFPYPPVTGQTIVVGAGGNLQSALNSAQRGDEIVLAAGATFSGNFTLPAKSGSAANGWITIRSDRYSQLPPIGTRVTAAQAGLMAKIETPSTAPAIRAAAGASGWRMVGLEVTASTSVTAQQYGLIFLGESGSAQNTLASVPSDLVLDRMYIHGQTTTNLSRCVALNSARTQVSDSYIVECHGKTFDSQAIAGWNGPGPYKIVNNTLQGAGENLMFGGADPSIPGLVPSDIEIRQNYLYTPVAWKGVWQKKNLFELKNAVRVLVEGNVFDGSWTDGQTGWAVILKSSSQSGGCRWCRTTDVTFRRNLIQNVGAGINLAPYGDNGAAATDTATRRVYIAENVLDVGAQPGDKRGFQMLARVQSVSLERNVLAGTFTTAAITEGGAPCVFRDNVWARGQYGVLASGSSSGTPSITKGCGTSYVWSGMTLIGTSSGTYPPGTTWLASASAAPLAASIRALVQQATVGVVVP